MILVECNYDQNLYPIQVNLEDKFQTVINKFMAKFFLPLKSVYLLGNGRNIDPEKTVGSQISNEDKRNKYTKYLFIYMTILIKNQFLLNQKILYVLNVLSLVNQSK